MEDGVYRLRFAAEGIDAEGRLCIENNRATGGDGLREMRGEFTQTGPAVQASFDVRCAATRPPIGASPTYTLRMFGTGTEQGFDLIGVGPLGLIIEITGEWSGPLGTPAG